MDKTAFREWRKSLGWSQARAAQELGVARETVVRWESGTEFGNVVMLELAMEQLGNAQGLRAVQEGRRQDPHDQA